MGYTGPYVALCLYLFLFPLCFFGALAGPFTCAIMLEPVKDVEKCYFFEANAYAADPHYIADM